MWQNFRDSVAIKYNQLFHRKKCIYTDEELTEYKSFTFLSKSQIKRVYYLFHSLDPELSDSEKNPCIEHEKILHMPELWLNPFKDRIVKVFSNDEPGKMYFEEYLEMMSVFSDKAPRKVKIEYAFRIYDFNDDGLIGPDDIMEMLTRLSGKERFSTEDCNEIVEKLMAEGDVDCDGFMTFPEFKHSMKKCPDFVHSFRIRI